MHLSGFIDYLSNEKRFSKHTIKSYEKNLIQFKDYLAIQYQLEDISKATYLEIRSWLVSLMEEKNAPQTVNQKLSTLQSFFKYLLKINVIKENPTRKVIRAKTPKRLPVFVEQSKMENLFSEIMFENSYEGQRDKLILELFYSTGIRLSELLGLKETDIDFYKQTIKVLGKRNKERIIPIGLSLQELLKSFIILKKQKFSDGDPYVFLSLKGKLLQPKAVYTIVKKYLGEITTISKKSPHVLRHTFATHMLNNGADINAIKEILGHANLAATQIYTHNSIEKLKKIHKQAHPKP